MSDFLTQFTSANQPANRGRKPNGEKYARPIAAAEKRIVDRLPQLVDKMLVLAYGVQVESINPITMEAEVYREKPDRAAAEYLLNRIMGKPTERIENAEGGPLFLFKAYVGVDTDAV